MIVGTAVGGGVVCVLCMCVGNGWGREGGVEGELKTHFTAESYETDLNMRCHSGIRKTLSYRQIIWLFGHIKNTLYSRTSIS